MKTILYFSIGVAIALCGFGFLALVGLILEPARKRRRQREREALDPYWSQFRHEDEDAFAIVLCALATAEGTLFLGREVVAFFDTEMEATCPHCDADLRIETDAEPWVVSDDDDPRPALEETSAAQGNDLIRYRELARQHGQQRLARWLDHLAGSLRCPECGASFVVAGALGG